MKNKKKYLAFIRSFSGLEAQMNSQDYVWEALSKNFERIYFINDDNLKFFPNFKQEWIQKKYDFEEIYKFVPKNVILFNPKNTKEFENFLKDKEIVSISNFRKLFQDLKTHYLMKKYKIKQIQILNFGHGFGMHQHVPIKNFLKFLNWQNKLFFQKLTTFLSSLGLISKIDIKFISDKEVLENITKNPIKNFLYKNKLLFAKELILTNSRSYDILLEKKYDLAEDYIVLLNANLNYWQEKEFRGKFSKKRVEEHYYYLKKFLQRLSNEYKKDVVVCIHPGHDLKESQSIFKEFKVVKFKTREYIYKAFLVTNFDSSAVDDAILLKKKAIGLISNYMSKNEITHTKKKASICGYTTLNIKDDFNFDKNKLISTLNSKIINNYEKNISNHHCFEPNVNGMEKIVKIIKERYF